MNKDTLKKCVADLLEAGIYKTTEQIVEEFRMEYPQLWRELEAEGQLLYGNSCSSVQQPATRIAQVLQSMDETRCLRRCRDKLFFWSKP
jgi:aspartate oxidase